MRDYEQVQFALIAHDYESRGFTVTRDWPLAPGITFDAMAEREGEKVVIEFVNKSRWHGKTDRLRAAFERLAEAYPSARVDLRYVDPTWPKWASYLEARQSDPTADLLATIEPEGIFRSLPSAQFLYWWTYLAAMLRAYREVIADSPPIEPLDVPKDIINVYNDLLRPSGCAHQM